MKNLFPITLISILFTSAASAQQPLDPSVEAPKIIAEAFAKLSAELTTAIAKDGPAKALTVCSVRAPQIASEVGKDHKVTIRRATNQPRNPKNIATDAEKTALSTFAAALVEKSPPKPQIITNSDDSRTFLAPIVISTPLCLQCHGNPANDIAKPTLDAIRKLYPDDKATGYQLGDLRGLWSITFPPEK
jgi:hypothetical protein